MDKEIREQIALKRYKLICPVLAEPGRVQNDYFRKQSEREHNLPHYGPRKIAVSTFKRWLALYKKEGFKGLKPKIRCDKGRPRRTGEKVLNAIRVKCKAFPYWTVRVLYENLRETGQLGDPVLSYNTVLRIVKTEKLLPAKGRKDVRKCFETGEFGQLWLADFMHGPKVLLGKKRVKAILCAIIDDHSRMIVGYAFNPHETISSLTVVLKEALLAYGLPLRFYVDNGSAFSSDLLAKSCALAGIALIHSKPYDSPSRGKIERFFRTVRARFISCLAEDITLDELNEAFSIWLREDYHQKIHSGINTRPIDRYHASMDRIDIRRLSKTELDEIFLIRHERIVGNDATISFKSKIYEVPSAYIRQRVELRHPVGDSSELFLYDRGVRICKIKLVDKEENARTFRPKKIDTTISFSNGRVIS